MKVNKNMVINDIISLDKGVIPILVNAGLHCIGCPSSMGETIGEAGFVHGMEMDSLIDEINAYLETLPTTSDVN